MFCNTGKQSAEKKTRKLSAYACFSVTLSEGKEKIEVRSGRTVIPPFHIHLINSHTNEPGISSEWVRS